MDNSKHGADRSAPRRQSTMGWLEYVIGGAAVLVSAISLQVGVSANQTQEKLLAASTWPYLQYGTGNRLGDGSSSITLGLENAGVGPARVHSVQVIYDGQPRADARALLDACCGTAGKPLVTITSSAARVFSAGQEVTFLRVDEAAADPAAWASFNQERFKVQVRACYCSVLKDCWVFDSLQAEPAPVATCPLLPEDSLWHG